MTNGYWPNIIIGNVCIIINDSIISNSEDDNTMTQLLLLLLLLLLVLLLLCEYDQTMTNEMTKTVVYY